VDQANKVSKNGQRVVTLSKLRALAQEQQDQPAGLDVTSPRL
jgi:hypothetical protein